jgi:hyperosmotically inducible periplasmic protein
MTTPNPPSSPLRHQPVTRRAPLLLALLLAAGAAPALAQLPDPRQDRLETEIRHELMMLPYYNVFDNLAFKVGDKGQVTLIGQVVRPTLKTDAERVVKRIPGVEQVTNEIETLPTSPNDDRIRIATYRAIYRHDALERYAIQAVPPIHIVVKNGHVTLEGAVGSDADRTIANLQARLVSGVFSVTNNLRVAP